MKPFLLVSRWIDAITAKVGKFSSWLILLTTLVSAGNAIVRKAFDTSSNSLLEIQWYLFAAVFLLGAGYGFLRNTHVRIDFVSGRFTPRVRNWIDLVGILLVLLPFCTIMIWMSWPLLTQAFESGEMSQNAGGLIRWPVYALIPAGFALLAVQGLSEFVKRLAFILGHGPDVLAHAQTTPQEQPTAAAPTTP